MVIALYFIILNFTFYSFCLVHGRIGNYNPCEAGVMTKAPLRIKLGILAGKALGGVHVLLKYMSVYGCHNLVLRLYQSVTSILNFELMPCMFKAGYSNKDLS